MEKREYRGSCLCGSVLFTVSGFSTQAAHCHCKMCRKFHGAAYSSFVTCSKLRWLCGGALLQEYCAPNGTIRSFCKQCGSSIGFRGSEQLAEDMEIAAGLFDDDIPVAMDCHIYTNYKANWDDRVDCIPMNGEGREKGDQMK